MDSTASPPSAPAVHLPALEGLRGVLAWWVVVGHTLLLAGFSEPTAPLALRPWLRADHAVDVFIILSGFVIALVLERGRDSYGAFVTRRFFRLYPAYVVCLAAAIAVNAAAVEALRSLPWAEERIVAWILQEDLSVRRHFWVHLVAHLTMLHGLIPAEVLADSPTAFLGPAWSVSLEWQFYLVAPLVVAWAKRGRAHLAVLALVVGLCALAAPAFGGLFRPAKVLTYSLPSLLPLKAIYFFIGAVSFAAWRRFSEGVDRETLTRGLIVALVLAAGVARSVSLSVWLLVLGSEWLRRAGAGAPIAGQLSAALRSRLLQWTGRVSYSTYLCHTPVLYGVVVGLAAISKTWSPWTFLASLAALGFPLILGMSYLLHRFVERPFIEAARRWTSRAPSAGDGRGASVSSSA